MEQPKRILWLDALRGFAIFAMLLHHLAFTLTTFFPVSLPFLYAALESRAFGILQPLFVALFFGISGISSGFSRKPFVRAGRVLLCALLVTLVTFLAFPEDTIWFGVLHCLGLLMLLYALFKKWILKIPPVWGLMLSLLLFCLCFRVPEGFILSFPLPKALYRGGLFTNFGFSSPHFRSFDYVPLIPHIFMFFAGVCIGRFSLPAGKRKFSFFAFLGKYSLWVYLLHQPLFFGIFRLIEIIRKG